MTQRLKVGDKLPDFTFLTLKDSAPTPVQLKDITENKKIVIFAVPGAFTPGCSKTHCPSFKRGAKDLKEKGIDAIYCTSVNDCFVLQYWAEDQKIVGEITMLADGNANFAKSIGLSKETDSFGGTRSVRYALIATNGIVDYIGIDDQGIELSTADNLLSKL
eukprot:TRINITY_DN390_c0_g2_i1.p1 TRINITY_DN390_c0_g2~~TRINITY_DN390_c0_g2_i1.p1  ORF type:complete len:178 (-),score=59.31 TRINITY_DN390_c0_g2_i1:91-573(-)